MAASFLSYIVQQHGLKFEDVATDALAHILRNSERGRSAFREFLNRFVPDLLPDLFSIETRCNTEGLGIPDLVFKDELERLCVIVEAKFSAGLTGHQPVSYLEQLRASGKAGMLVFLVPHSKLTHYSQKARAQCSDDDVSWQGSVAKEGHLFVRFVSWNECLAVLRVAEPITSEYGAFLQDLERMCQVAEPDLFKELDESELAALSKPENQAAQRTRNFMKLAAEIAKRSFSNTQKDWAKYDNAWGASWSGLYGRIADTEAWIGIDSTAWCDHGKSPIWLEIEGKDVQHLEVRVRSLNRGAGYFMRNNNTQIAIPILLGPGSRDEVLERCCDQVDRVRGLLKTTVLNPDPSLL